jgi:tetratricopeptide (TPR) repeat protein
MDNYEKLGDYHKKVTVKNEEGQIWVDRAFQYLFGYCHIHAINCFKKALEFDPDCAMAHWGIAYCYGPHYNLMMYSKKDYDIALKHLEQASINLSSLMDWEKDLIEVTHYRYPQECPENEKVLQTLTLFKEKLYIVYKNYPKDLDIAAYYAEAIMNLRPWTLWKKNGEPYPEAKKF